MTQPVDQRVVKLVQQCDAERKARIAAERRASALRAVIARMQRQTKPGAVVVSDNGYANPEAGSVG
jgi:hypothetical protein